jgi:wobble nucleotide-excising tRNase
VHSVRERGTMLKKFIAIKNVGKFRNCGAAGDIEFRKLSLVYAENGRGKTTLCAILRSLQNGDPLFITERRTVDGNAAPQIDALTAAGKLTFDGNAWSGTYGNMVVFDSTYVAENVYSGDFVEHEHRKRLYQVSIGKQGVELAHKVSDLDGKSRELAGKLQESSKALTKKLPAGTTLEQFLALAKDDGIDTKIADKKKAIEALTDAEAIKTRAGFVKLTCPALPTGLADVLGKALEGVSKDVEAKIHEHIAAHGMGKPGEAWLSQGLPYVTDDSCPFCGLTIAHNDLIQNYRIYFGQAYNSLKSQIAALNTNFSAAFSEKKNATMQTAAIQNQANAEFWKRYTTIALPELDYDNAVKPVLETLTATIDPLILQKAAAPLEVVAISEEAQKPTEALASLKATIDAYNSAVDAANAAVDAIKKAVTTGNLPTLRKELAQLEAQKARHGDELSSSCLEHQNTQKEKTKVEEDKAAVKKQLDEYTEKILQQYEEGINKLLDRFGAGFRITGTKQQYLGGSPSSTFKLSINGVPIELGDSKTPRGTPCFRSTMSSGDRNTLALAFFLVQLFQRPDIGDLTVVFDDPLTSLDRFRQQFTRDQIRAVEKKAKQVIVLSHEPAFLQLIADGFDQANLRLLVLSRDGVSDTVIKLWDMTTELAPGYHKDVATLSAYYHGEAEDLRAVVRCIRPVMEGYLRSTYHGSFAEKEWLGGMIDRIRDAAAGSPLDTAKPMLADIESLNDFTKRYHHDDNSPKQGTEPIQDVELQAFTKLTLKLTNRL